MDLSENVQKLVTAMDDLKGEISGLLEAVKRYGANLEKQMKEWEEL